MGKVLARSCNLLLFKGIPELFNYRISQDVARDPSHFGLGLRSVQPTVERKLKELALPDIRKLFIPQLLQCALDGFALRIKNAALQ